MRQLDDFVARQYRLGLDVELRPTDDGPLLIIGDALFEGQPKLAHTSESTVVSAAL